MAMPTDESSPANHDGAGDADAELRRRARRRARAKLGFYKHLAVYALVNIILLAVNLATSPGALWFYWPLLGWGAAVGVHGARVYWFGAAAGAGLRARLEEDELRKLKGGG